MCQGRHRKEESQHGGAEIGIPGRVVAMTLAMNNRDKDLLEEHFTENRELAVPREKPHCGFQCWCLRSEGERARQLFLAPSLYVKRRRDSLIARDTERQLTTEGERKMQVHLVFFLNCFF